MAGHPTPKNTKNEILAMYEVLLQEKEGLEAKVRQLQKEKTAAPIKAAVPASREAPEKKPPVLPSTLGGIIETLSTLRPGFGDAVSELSAQLISEASKLQELRNNVEAEIQQLEALHGLKVQDETLGQLIQQYLEKSTEFEGKEQERRENFGREMAEKKSAWQKEQTEHARIIKERDDTTKKKEQRETAEYSYALELRRDLEIDRYQQEREQLEKALKDFEARKKTEWTEREKEIAAQEVEFNTIRTQVEKFPKEQEAAVKKSRDEGAKAAQHQAKVHADLRAKEAEGEQRISELKIESLEENIQKQREQIHSLSTQLDAVVKQSQTLAMKAIEGTSSAGSLKAVREIALEQAKNPQKAK